MNGKNSFCRLRHRLQQLCDLTWILSSSDILWSEGGQDILWFWLAFDTAGEVTDRARGRPKGPHPAPHRSRPYGYERHFATSITFP